MQLDKVEKGQDIDENWVSPIEEYDGVLYKRDDLFAPFKNGVNGGKARQTVSLIKLNLNKIKNECNNTVITATNVDSPQGVIISTVASHYGIRPIIAFGSAKGDPEVLKSRNLLVRKAEEAGGDIQVIARAGYTSVINKALTETAINEDYFPIKFGMNLNGNKDSIFGVISNQVQNIPQGLDNLLIPVGSGMIFSAIIKGLIKYNIKPKRVIGILSGANTMKDIDGYLSEDNVCRKGLDDAWGLEDEGRFLEYELYQSPLGYHDKKFINEPFEFDPIYEVKTKLWFDEHIDKSEKSLIWIVGTQKSMY